MGAPVAVNAGRPTLRFRGTAYPVLLPSLRDPRLHLAAVIVSLQELSEDRRRAVTLYLQGHSIPEAARILEWDVKRTENLVYRGLADLRTCLLRKGHRP